MITTRCGWRDIHSGMNAQGEFPVHPRSRAQLVRTSVNPARYERRLPDGRVDVYGQPDGGPLGAQRVFLTERRDARGQCCPSPTMPRRAWWPRPTRWGR